jgi:serine protease
MRWTTVDARATRGANRYGTRRARGAARRSAVVGLLVLIAAPAEARLVPRAAPAKPARTLVHSGQAADRVVVKFTEGTGVRLGARGFAAPAQDLAALEGVLQAAGVDDVRRLFTRPTADLDAERARAQRLAGQELADLNLYYEVKLPRGQDMATLCEALNALPIVELATPAPLPAPAPLDLEPPTPDFTMGQVYRSAAPFGIGADAVAAVPGADGAGTTILDVEYAWVLDHEDLELPPAANIDPAALADPFPADEGSHGTAVLGVLGAEANTYGVLGLAAGATRLVSPANTLAFGYDVGRAVSLATAVLGPGDVILIEQQIGVCGTACENGVHGCGPVEYFAPWFDAIATATALGIVVVEAAGNGNVDLDVPVCNGAFDRSVRDSGAVIVGAGSAVDGSRLVFSSYGSRVDVHGWGELVTTAGYGDLFDPGDVRQRYTSSFGGTSSASAIVAGAASAVQGARLAAGAAPLAPRALRERLHATGTPQNLGPRVGNIGPLPNLVTALFCGDGVVDPTEGCDDGNVTARDGCSVACQVEECATCTGAPSSCVVAKACPKCARAIGQAGARLALARATALARCEIAKLRGTLPPATACETEPKTATRLARAASRMAATITRRCAGKDHVCGTNDPDEVTPQVLRWPATCPNLDNGGCTNAIRSCDDIIACLACTHATAVDQTSALVFAELQPSPSRRERRLNTCQRAIGKETFASFGTQTKTLQRCWDQRRRHRHTEDCSAGGALGPGRAAAARIARAQTTARQRICRACGGKDKQCGGGDDLSPETIGFTPLCDAVRTGDGTSCSHPIATLNDLATCVACVADFQAGCMDAARVPEFIAYPAACNPPPAGSCCEARDSVACESPTCTRCVCTLDSYCCATAWDAICAGEAQEPCAADCPCAE